MYSFNYINPDRSNLETLTVLLNKTKLNFTLTSIKSVEEGMALKQTAKNVFVVDAENYIKNKKLQSALYKKKNKSLILVLHKNNDDLEVTESGIESVHISDVTSKCVALILKYGFEKIDLYTAQLIKEKNTYALLNSSQEGAVIVDVNKKIIFYNTKFSNIIDTTDIEGTNFDELLSKYTSDIYIIDLIQSGRTHQFTLQKNDVKTEISLKKIEVTWNNNTSTLFLFKDITEEVALKFDLYKERFKQRVIDSDSDEIVCILTKNGVVMEISKSVHESLGFTPEFLTGKNIFDLMPKQTAEIQRYLFKKTVQSLKRKDSNSVLMSVFTSKGEERIYSVKINDHSTTKFIEGYVIHANDVTDLENSRAKYQELVNTISEGIVLVNKNDKIEYINTQAKTILEYTLSEGPEYSSELFNNRFSLYNIFVNNECINSTEDIIRKEINIFDKWILLQAKPKQAHLDHSSSIIVAISDMTHLKEQEKLMINNILNAEEKERERFAFDLHDGLGQTISAASMHFKALDKNAKANFEPAIYEKFKTSNALLSKAVSETRFISHNMAPRSLNKFGLEQTLEEFFESLRTFSSSIKLEYKLDILNSRFPSNIEINVYRTIQESINNILKHAEATTVKIDLNYSDKNLLFLSILDNGKGFDNEKVKLGLGLQSIEKRINSINGKIDISSAIGHGTVINVVIPTQKQ